VIEGMIAEAIVGYTFGQSSCHAGFPHLESVCQGIAKEVFA
jgi:hypothetical protein